MSDYLTELEQKLPQFLTSQDLVDLGLYPNKDGVHFARHIGRAPDCIHIGRKLLFPKQNVLDFIKKLTEAEKSQEVACV